MRGVSRMSFAELRDQLPEVLAEAGRSTGPRPGSALADTARQARMVDRFLDEIEAGAAGARH